MHFKELISKGYQLIFLSESTKTTNKFIAQVTQKLADLFRLIGIIGWGLTEHHPPHKRVSKAANEYFLALQKYKLLTFMIQAK